MRRLFAQVTTSNRRLGLWPTLFQNVGNGLQHDIDFDEAQHMRAHSIVVAEDNAAFTMSNMQKNPECVIKKTTPYQRHSNNNL